MHISSLRHNKFIFIFFIIFYFFFSIIAFPLLPPSKNIDYYSFLDYSTYVLVYLYRLHISFYKQVAFKV
jgi:hypothetical protein